jgi:U3 small nucleolar RNA-associated protein 21
MRSTDTKGPQSLTAVCMSACGNYAFIGSRSGWIDQFNIQSGQHRRAFRAKDPLANHTASIQGLAVDAMNRYVISASLDGSLKFWSFKDGSLIKSVELDAPITQIEIQRESGLLAVVCDDLILRVYDIETQVLVRRLQGHSSLITDVAFSGDARWLASASGGGHLRVWDLPSGHCIDWVKMHSPITSLSFSPRTDFLATTHVDSRGIFLWANQNYFSNIFLRPIRSDETEPDEIAMPSLTAGLEGAVDEDSSDSSDDMDTSGSESEDKTLEMSPDEVEADADQLSAELITLSRTPRSKWRTLVNLDIIQERNKPIKAPEQPKAAPFILPTLPGVEPKFVATTEGENADGDSSRIIDMSKLRPKTKFVVALEAAVDAESSDQSVGDLVKLIEAMTPSNIDFEIRSLSQEDDCNEFKMVMKFILAAIRTNASFEVIESILNVFLKVHGDVVAREASLQELAKEIRREQSQSWSRLQDLMHQNLCLISYFSNLQT